MELLLELELYKRLNHVVSKFIAGDSLQKTRKIKIYQSTRKLFSEKTTTTRLVI